MVMRYTGVIHGNFTIHSCIGGLNEDFVASGSEGEIGIMFLIPGQFAVTGSPVRASDHSGLSSPHACLLNIPILTVWVRLRDDCIHLSLEKMTIAVLF